MVKLDFTEEELKKFESVSWEIGDDDNWWFDLLQSSFKVGWDCDELIKSIQKDVDEKLSVDEIYVKYEKIKC